ncbi:BamA/TamA family outer membrane protein [Hymenobacter chitinivorans]|uniref:Surface antigen-like protein n=1 Tax=Hymenobacter chitinivorans DSM 11115 TaxID=1121954 RepID=A0A2M9AQ43_9BACT|nr:BamA/TamA family outer membrane protein [Hymenobacter chitinivorans]PJJ47809.1 surface antigen-like protein [Hymenobacter chitinivorans DSM 11115]
MRLFYLFLSGSLLATRAYSQTPAPTSAGTPEPVAPVAAVPKPAKPSFLPFPIVFSQPETGLGYGVAMLPVWRFGQDTVVRKSNARLILWRTQNNQSLVQLTHNVFTPGEKFLVNGELSYFYKYPINYYGFGPSTSRDDESTIEYKLVIVNQRVLRQVKRNVFAGLQYRLTNLRDVRVRKNIDEGTPQQRPSLLLQRPGEELRASTISSGVGPAFLYDGRDNILSAYRGNYLELSALFNGGALGSDFRFSRYLLDARHYQALGPSSKTILATQLVGQFQSGHVPFRELANLGGDKILRGYYEGRYRDRQLVALQAELRRPLFWRFNGAIFGSLGQVGNTVGDLGRNSLKATGGAGIRFKYNRRDRLNIRFDYGLARDGSTGFYFSIGEAF